MVFESFIALIMIAVPLDLQPGMSTVDGEFIQSTFMPGTLVGDWNEKTNPSGTTTIPGVWGGSGNNLIACELTPSFGGLFDSSLGGALEVDLKEEDLKVDIDGLMITAFEESPYAFGVSVGMLYETFRTTQPDSLYPGGIPFDLPIGEGYLTQLVLEQSISAEGDVVYMGDNQWQYSIFIPVTITFEVEVLGTSTGPLPAVGVLQMTGSIEDGETQTSLTGDLSWFSNEVIESPPIAFEDVPLPLPTVLPPGETANLLLSAIAESATFNTSINWHIEASGQLGLPGDVDGDGYVGVNDLLAIIAVWGPCANCDEDLNGDSVVNVNDLLEVIGNWSGV